MGTHPSENALLVEIGWEVCWQLGGIYTVLKTKAKAMVDEWGDRYLLVGPYNRGTAEIQFEPLPRTGIFGQACDILEREKGVSVHFGKWLIAGEPQVVLIDFNRYRHRANELKYLMWKDHGIQTGDEKEVEDCVIFGYLVADFLEALVAATKQTAEAQPNDVEPCPPVSTELAQTPASEEATETSSSAAKILAHFHEWMAGVAIPELLKRRTLIHTVFTTHATILGRYLAADDANFYQNIAKVDPYQEARRRNIYPRFAIERAATWGANCFTTISEITAIESEYLLGRKPDALLPNGLNITRFAAVHEFQNLHLIYKKKIQEFLMGHFFPSYTFDLNKTLHIFTSGRYEHRNKGLDLFIESLARLNWRLKAEKKDVTVIAFIITRAPVHGFSVEALKNQMLFSEMSSHCETISSGVASKLLFGASTGADLKKISLIDDAELYTLKQLVHAWKQTSPTPQVVTHKLIDEWRDPIFAQLRSCGLMNHASDPVKVVYHPEFLTSASPLISLDYEQFVRGCHLGVFPSYYEPWGYTPAECAALGIPAITSDLAGFGSFVQKNIEDPAERGLFVINRLGRSFNESASQLTDTIFKVMTMSMRERIELRNRVEAESAKFDWRELIPAYRRAHRIALAKAP